jgi:hypothetical protein
MGARAILGMLAAFVLALAFALVERIPEYQIDANPPGGSEVVAPPEVATVFRRSCYDCHSNRTRWPWYTHVEPASRIALRDVAEGRRRLNFSDWGAYVGDPETAITKLGKIRDSMAEGAMPPWYYRLLHRDAALSAADRKLVVDWCDTEIAKLQQSEADSNKR